MGNIIDLTGLKFGKLIVVGFAGQDNYGHCKWNCKCDCGGESVSLSSNLKSGKATSCGCINKEYENLIGKKYGRLIIKKIDHRKKGKIFWECVCDCGSVNIVSSCDLKNGHTKSCGCLSLESRKKEKKHEDFTGRKIGRLKVLRVKRREGSKRYWECVCDCGRNVEVISGHLQNGNTLSCGCYMKEEARKRMINFHITRKKKGMRGTRWNPELSMEDRSISKNRQMLFPEISVWRITVFRRDYYTCQVCGVKSVKNLVAHHKNAWKKFKEDRFLVENGVTVCSRCHIEFHSKYGSGNNTKQQWEEFIEHKKKGCAA